MKKLLYYLLYAVWLLLSLLPLRVHYVIADGLYLLVYRLLHYRVHIVRQNLERSFPDRSEAERRQIEHRFYHWFCDYIVETVKLLTISPRQLRRRMVFKGTELIEQCVADGQSCAVYLGHYCNWEWITSLPMWVSPKAQCGQIYHALENPEFDRLFLRLRQRFGAACIPMAETLRRLVMYKQQNKPVVIGYISDQTPFWNNIHHWLTFLRQDTPVLTGTERIAAQTGHAVFYIDVTRPRRGYYEAEFKLITREPKSLPEFAITDEYFRLLECSIDRDPAYWLWTHNRWKRTHEEFDRQYRMVNGKAILREDAE